MTGPVATAFHLARRFVGSLRPGPPRPADEAWARDRLGEGERAIWDRMDNPDRRHAVAVARAVEAGWTPDLGGATPGREVLAAALLHDSGKVEAGLGTFGRVGATLVWLVLDDRRADRWLATGAPGVRGRLARYRRHPELGGAMLRRAGSHPLTSAWAEEHHRPPTAWTVPPSVGGLLKDCDDD